MENGADKALPFNQLILVSYCTPSRPYFISFCFYEMKEIGDDACGPLTFCHKILSNLHLLKPWGCLIHKQIKNREDDYL